VASLRDMWSHWEGRKAGLALSGGGFRASFFHVGVLARLAELEILPKVEVISTVSGGSIVGALYYICLKQRLDSLPDGEIGKDGYIELVAEVEERLRKGVQRNIRTRVFANPLKNAGMVLSSRYSRSDRIGDLYDRYLYKEAWRGSRPRKWKGRGPERQIALRELLIEPRGEKFDPATENRKRLEKVPILLVNATSLNSGHNWRFEAIRMGESLPEDPQRGRIVDEVDKNMRLAAGYFDPGPEQNEVPEQKANFPLALAVAASAGVPGVFQPLAINDMYKDIRVQLVDGGVQDNQGVQGLFDRGCKQLIVSDASGQMGDIEKPSARIPGVLGRSASIEGDRIRDEQLIDTLNGPYRRHALMHLRKGLDGKVVAPENSLPEAEPERRGKYGTNDFEVHHEVQEALSRIRTDLDFFGDDEAFSLELDGYLMSGFELERSGFAKRGEADAARTPGWAFSHKRLRDEIREGKDPILRTLRMGRQKFFRPLLLRPVLAAIVAVLALAAMGAAVWAAWDGIADLLGGRWPAWLVLLVFFVAAVLGLDYAADPRWKPIRYTLWPAFALLSIPLALLAAAAALPVFAWVNLAELARKARPAP
jgi:NTE family protein